MKKRLFELSLLSDAEINEMTVQWNQTETNFPRGRCFHELFQVQVRKSPDAVAVSCLGERLTYAELNRRANLLAHGLVAQGVCPDTVVPLLGNRNIDFLVSMLAVFKAGGAYLPLDPHHPPQRQAIILEQSRSRLLVVQDRYLDQARELQQQSDGDLKVVTSSELAQEGEEDLSRRANPGHLAYVIYTSGSTGAPKGAMVEHLGMLNHLYAKMLDLELTGVDRVAQTASHCFDISVWQYLAVLLVGGKVEVYPDEIVMDPLRLLQLVEKDEVSILEIVPSLLRSINHELQVPGAERCSLSRLRWLLLTGEALPPELCRQWLGFYPEIPILNAYGPTECSDDVTHHPVHLQPDEKAIQIPIGRPIANTKLYILDSGLKPVPIETAGELFVGGVGVGRGYLHDPEKTAERFIPNPFTSEPGSRLYRTGDLVRYHDDGCIEFLGRLDHQVKIRGFRIELGEIEAVLKRCKGVRETVVVAREDTPGTKRLVAYLVADGGVGVENLRQYLEQKLPEYMVPSAYVFLDAFPLSSNGKLDRKALPAPEPARTQQDQYALPRNQTEESLARIWREVLKIERVGIHDNFFALGGDSILSIQIISRANQEGLRITPMQLFEHQTISTLAAVAGSARTILAEQGTVSGPVPLTPIQHWFFEQELPDPDHWNMAVLLETHQPLDPSWLDLALHHLVAHHDALRLRFRQDGGKWRQENAPMETGRLLVCFDLSGLSEAEKAATLERQAGELQSSLNLMQGPLLRAGLFEAGPEEGYLFLAIHHLAVDGISWRILLEDLQRIYGQLSRGDQVTHPGKTTSFRYWAGKLAARVESEPARWELEYWSPPAFPERLELPVDWHYGENTRGLARTITTMATAEETEALLHEVPARFRTQIHEVLLTALVLTVGKWTREPRLLVDLEGHGREELFEEVDLSRTVGWFTSIYPVLLDVTGATTPVEALRAVKEQLRRVPGQGLGFGLHRYLSGKREVADQLERYPQPALSFNYLGQFDQVLQDASLFALSDKGSGPLHSLKGRRLHQLEIYGWVSEGVLRLNWMYGDKIHRGETIREVADGYHQNLRQLIQECRGNQGLGYTPVDFPRAALDQKTLDKVMTKITQRNE